MGKHIILESLSTILTPIKHLLDKLEANKVDRSELNEVLDSKVNKDDLDEAISSLVNSAPETLDTLGELATALQENEDVIETLNNSITNKMDKNNPKGTGSFSLNRVGDIGKNSVSMGTSAIASGEDSFSMGSFTKAIGNNSQAEGNFTIAYGNNSHAEGDHRIAYGNNSHAEGHDIGVYSVKITGEANSTTYTYTNDILGLKVGYVLVNDRKAAKIVAINNNTITLDQSLSSTALTSKAVYCYGGAFGLSSHAEGSRTYAIGDYSHVEGFETIATSMSQHVQGKYNIYDDEEKYAHIVGNGTANNAHSNAHTLDWDGNAWFAGDVYVGSTSGTNEDEGSKKLATEELVATKKNKDLIVTYAEGSNFGVTHSTQEIYEAIQNGTTVYFQKDTELLNLMEITANYATFFMFYMNMEGKPQQKVIVISDSSIMLDQDDTYNYADSNAVLLKTAQTLTDTELTQVRKNLKFIGEDVEGKTFTIDGQTYTASPNAERFGDYINNIAIGQWSIAEGSGTIAKGRASHAEGAYSHALQDGSHVEGYQTKATGYWSHAEGEMTTVSSYASHAEGSYCTLPNGTKRYGTASGYASHVEGGGCHTTGSCSHAEGLATTASGAQSHVEGRYTIAAGGAQHVEGIANIEDAAGDYIHIAGNGSFDDRSNAYTLDWNGTAWFSGDVYVGSASGKNKDEGSQKLITSSDLRGAKLELEDYVNNELSHKGIIRKEGTIVQHDCVKNMGISVISYIPAGTTNISLLHCGKNICPGVVMGAAYMTKTGIFNTSQPNYTSTEKFPVFAGVQYIDSTNNNTAINRKTFHYWDVDGNWLGVRLGNEGYTINDRIEGAVMMAVTYYNPDATQIAQWAQVEIGTVATDYEEYKGEEFSCDFGGAVSGGEFNWNTGILTIADDDMTQVQFESHNILSFEGVNTIASADGSHVVDFNRDVYRVAGYVTKDYVDELKNQLTIDDTVLADSKNAVSGAAVAAYVAEQIASIPYFEEVAF